MEDRRIRFNEFVDAVAMSPQSRDARRQGDVSVLYPEHYPTSRCLNRWPRRPRTFRHSLRCCSCQCDNGQWPVTRDVMVLGGVVPLPPEGISVPRWVTALVVTYVRRFPEYFGAMADCVDRALEWIDATSTRALLLGRS